MFRVLLILSFLFVLPACTELELASHVAKQVPIPEQRQSKGTFKVGKSYRIAGNTYHPQERYSYSQTGTASWYGPNFHGKKTANGEIFDKYELTAAHKTLQMPSIVRVTNLENGRSIVVRINDRGPFKKGRIIDLSERGAELLDFKHKGVAKVKIQVLNQESRKVAEIARNGGDTRGFEIAVNEQRNAPVRLVPDRKPVTQPGVQPQLKPQTEIAKSVLPDSPTQIARKPLSIDSGIFVQTGAFGSHGNALAMAKKLQSFGQAKVSPTLVNGNRFYRVRLGPFKSASQADTLVAQIASADIGEPIIIVE